MKQEEKTFGTVTALIIEDVSDEKEDLLKGLKQFNYNCKTIEFDNGEDALRFIRNEHGIIDIFFIDIKLPGMSGFSFVNEIRQMDAYVQAPVVFMTGYDMDELSAYQQYHCYSYINKPYNQSVLEKRIGSLLRSLHDRKRNGSLERNILIQTIDGDAIVKVSDIYGAEIINRACYLYTTTARYQLKRQPLSEIISMLDCPSVIRCHRAYAINISKVKEIKKDRRNIWIPIFQKETSFKCEISKSYYERVLFAFMKGD